MTRKRRNPMLDRLKKAVEAVLADNNGATVAERLKAIEAGAKLLMIEHRITDDGRDTGDSFFG